MHISEEVKNVGYYWGVIPLAITGFVIVGVKGLLALDQRIKFSEKVFNRTPESRKNIVAAIGMATGIAAFFAFYLGYHRAR